MRMSDNSSLYAKAVGISTAAAGLFTLEEWAIIIGIICTVGTFLVNWHYKRKEFKLRERANSGKDIQ